MSNLWLVKLHVLLDLLVVPIVLVIVVLVVC